MIQYKSLLSLFGWMHPTTLLIIAVYVRKYQDYIANDFSDSPEWSSFYYWVK
jgi:hypothetical protein